MNFQDFLDASESTVEGHRLRGEILNRIGAPANWLVLTDEELEIFKAQIISLLIENRSLKSSLNGNN